MIISSAQIDYMLAERYTPEKLRLYLNADDRWLMLLRIDSPTEPCCWLLQLCVDGRSR